MAITSLGKITPEAALALSTQLRQRFNSYKQFAYTIRSGAQGSAIKALENQSLAKF